MSVNPQRVFEIFAEAFSENGVLDEPALRATLATFLVNSSCPCALKDAGQRFVDTIVRLTRDTLDSQKKLEPER